MAYHAYVHPQVGNKRALPAISSPQIISPDLQRRTRQSCTLRCGDRSSGLLRGWFVIFLIVLGVCSMLGGGGRGCMGRLFGGLGMRLVCVLRRGMGWVEVKACL